MTNTYTFDQKVENRETFFSRISRIYPLGSKELSLIEKAYTTAKDAFRDVRRDSGERYFEHLRSVSLILIDVFGVTDYRLICTALLHDIVEDIPEWSADRVELEFGPEIAFQVAWMTHPMNVLTDDKLTRKKVYAGRFLYAPREVFLIKIADLLHNLSSLNGVSSEKRERFPREAREYFLPVAVKRNVHPEVLESAIASLE